jgi:hypothetical protein
MRYLILLFFCALAYINVFAQPVFSVGFSKTVDTLQKNVSEDKNYKFQIKKATIWNQDSIKGYTVHVEVDYTRSSLLVAEYSMDFRPIPLKDLAFSESYSFYVNLIKDSLPNEPKTLYLSLKIRDSSGRVITRGFIQSDSMTMRVTILGVKTDTPLSDYTYLAYIGTNFDLVDGVQATKPFFATNIFVPPSNRCGNSGFYLSLYGNRAFTSTDTSTLTIRNSGSQKLNDSTVAIFREQSKLVRTTISDNLGAFISGAFHLGKCLSDEKNKIQLYYSPSVEFVWRRTQITTTSKDPLPVDTLIQTSSNNYPVIFPNSFVSKANEFNVKYGVLGIFIRHESEKMSVRVQGSIGYSQVFFPSGIAYSSNEPNYKWKGDVFFAGRAWITEAKSGITIQAEIVNYINNPKPLFVVTLSKAIPFSGLAGIFDSLKK